MIWAAAQFYMDVLTYGKKSVVNAIKCQYIKEIKVDNWKFRRIYIVCKNSPYNSNNCFVLLIEGI